jgi:hypothetical protein
MPLARRLMSIDQHEGAALNGGDIETNRLECLAPFRCDARLHAPQVEAEQVR